MVTATKDAAASKLSLLEELILMLLNEESGYFHQVPGWALNCTVVGAAIAELSLRARIDTDEESLFIVDRKATGDPTLDPILNEIAADPVQRSARYWIERLTPHAESIIDLTLNRMVDLNILDYHDGEFWTLARTAWRPVLFSESPEGAGATATQYVKARISNAIFENEIPDPKDAIIINLVNTCDVFRFIFQLDDETEERIQLICRLDSIGRSIAEAVSQNIAAPLLRRSHLTKKIPTVQTRRLLFNSNLRKGNVAALLADLTNEYGPVFEVRPPLSKPMVFIAGPEVNRWVNRSGRLYLRAKDYFSDFEKIYGASGVLPSLDGAEHFRLRRSLGPAYSRGRLAEQLDEVYRNARAYMAGWNVGDVLPATSMCRRMINAQLSPLFIGVETQDIIDDLVKYKERALSVHVMKILPKFTLSTPDMKRRAKAIDTLLERVQSAHTPAQRAGQSRTLTDDLLSLHASDPGFVPESNLRFALSAALIASVYLGDGFSFAVYAMASQPELYEKIRSEADALFDGGDPDGADFTPSAIDVTHRFLMECLRMYPIVPMSIRNVMNTCVVEGYELPLGTRLYIAQTAAHYMDEVFPDPFTFDVDRYLPPRNEHLSPGYAPYGLGTHRCLGSQWMNLQLAVNLLMLAHYFTLEVRPSNYSLRFSPLPSMKPTKKLKFLVAEQRRDLNV